MIKSGRQRQSNTNSRPEMYIKSLLFAVQLHIISMQSVYLDGKDIGKYTQILFRSYYTNAMISMLL